jgi:hypothetical protein
MTYPIPNRMSTDMHSVFYDPNHRRVGVRFNGEERHDVHEYDMNRGWIVVRRKGRNGKWALDERGHYVLDVLHGDVEAYWRTPPAPEQPAPGIERNDEAHLSAAAAKRARKATKRAALAERSRPQ